MPVLGLRASAMPGGTVGEVIAISGSDQTCLIRYASPTGHIFLSPWVSWASIVPE